MSVLEHSITSQLSPALGLRLLNDYQASFPLCPAPFAELASRLGVAESAVLRMLEQLRREGEISRVGAVFSPKKIGASTLVAMSVPRDRLARTAETVNRFPEVNRSDVREHLYSLWFVVTAGSEGRLQAALSAIENATGFPSLRLPLLRKFQKMPQTVEGTAAGRPGAPVVQMETIAPSTMLDEIGRRLVMALQEGLPLFIRPFSVLASRVGCDEAEVLERIRQWCAEGVIKRFGVVVPKRLTEDSTNAMLVLDVPDDDIARVGALLACEADILFCYERPRVLPVWPYSLFCLLGGQVREVLQAKVADLRQRLGLADCAFDILYPAQ